MSLSFGTSSPPFRTRISVRPPSISSPPLPAYRFSTFHADPTFWIIKYVHSQLTKRFMPGYLYWIYHLKIHHDPSYMYAWTAPSHNKYPVSFFLWGASPDCTSMLRNLYPSCRLSSRSPELSGKPGILYLSWTSENTYRVLDLTVIALWIGTEWLFRGRNW